MPKLVIEIKLPYESDDPTALPVLTRMSEIIKHQLSAMLSEMDATVAVHTEDDKPPPSTEIGV